MIELTENERLDDLNYKGMKLIQSTKSFCFGTDSVLLSGFTKVNSGDKLVDLGAGSGVLSILIYARTQCSVTAIEIDAEQCSRLERSVELNHISDKVKVINADYLKLDFNSNNGIFSAAVCNPPYFRADCGKRSKTAGATHETIADIDSIAQAASKLLKFGGKFFICFPVQRLAEAIVAMSNASLEVKRIRPVCSRKDKPPYLCLIEAKKGAKPGMIFENSLVIYDEEGNYTEETAEIYHMDGNNNEG